MKFTCESELMKNQKHADVMAPDVAFEVLQSSDGSALFFSIGTDNVLYVTREVPNSGTGWTKADLSSPLSASHGGAHISAKTFAVAQNPKTLVFDLAFVATVAGSDYLYLSLGHAGGSDTWEKGVSWTLAPFDATGVSVPSPLTIADVYLMQIPSTGGAVQNCFVDILRSSTSSLQILDRYYIQPTSTPHWNRHTLPVDLASGPIHSCLGNRTGDRVPGIYTFGNITDTTELIFTPQYNILKPTTPPAADRLTLPAGATAISSSLNSTGVTNLFVSGTDGLYLFTPSNQKDRATPTKVVSSSVVAGASSLAASTIGSLTAVWGLNPQGTLFYVYCAAGHEATPSAWSAPVPLLTGVEGFAFYLNIMASNNVLFAHLSGQTMVQLTQDPVTTIWSQRNILLATTDINDMVEYDSFTTHIQITDDNGVAIPSTAVTLTSTSPVSVYVNNAYSVLNPAIPLNVTSDATGTITIIQETQSLAAINFRITMLGSSTVFADINPMSKTMQTLSTVKSSGDLSNVQITNASGSTQPLVSSSVSEDDKVAAASSISQLVQASASLPADGSSVSVVPTNTKVTVGHEAVVAWQHWRNSDKTVDESLSTTSVDNSIVMAAGDLFGWIKHIVHDVESTAIFQDASKVYHFLAKIGSEVYSAVLNSMSAVLHGVEFVFNKIKVAFEDLIAWVGFLFHWDDIVRTHKVIKNVLKQYARKAILGLGTVGADFKKVFADFESKLNSWADITDPDQNQPMSSVESSTSSNAPPGSDSPQSNWGAYHTKSNSDSADTSYVHPVKGGLDQLIHDLSTLVASESEAIKTTVGQVRTQIIDQLSSLTPIQVLKKFLAIVGDLLLKTAENIILALVDVLKVVLDGVLDLFDAKISIPIISPIYKKVAGDDLSFLDLLCLVGAIPATIVYKLGRREAPYPDNSFTQQLINAPDFASIVALLSGTSEEVAAVSGTSLPPLRPLDIANVIFNVLPFWGGAMVATFSAMKRFTSHATPPPVILYMSIASYLLYIAPDISEAWESPSEWPTITNDVITAISFAKTFADNMPGLAAIPTWNDLISPAVESYINYLWLVPDIGGLATSSQPPLPSEGLSFTSNLMFDLGGYLTIVTALPGPEGNIVWVVQEGMTLLYGLLQLGVAGALLGGH